MAVQAAFRWDSRLPFGIAQHQGETHLLGIVVQGAAASDAPRHLDALRLRNASSRSSLSMA